MGKMSEADKKIKESVTKWYVGLDVDGMLEVSTDLVREWSDRNSDSTHAVVYLGIAMAFLDAFIKYGDYDSEEYTNIIDNVLGYAREEMEKTILLCRR